MSEYTNIVSDLEEKVKILILCGDRESQITQIMYKASKALKDCRNELCLKCRNYRQAHHGACDGCRWRDIGRRKKIRLFKPSLRTTAGKRDGMSSIRNTSRS